MSHRYYIDWHPLIRSIIVLLSSIFLFGLLNYIFWIEENKYNAIIITFISIIMLILVILGVTYSIPLVVTPRFMIVSSYYANILRIDVRKISYEEIHHITNEARSSSWGNFPYIIIVLHDGSEYIINKMYLSNKNYRTVINNNYYPLILDTGI